MKLILLEGLDDISIINTMNNIKNKLIKCDKKAEVISFPRYNEKSGLLVKDHLMEFPKPILSEVYHFKDLYLNLSNEKILFSQDIITNDIQLLEVNTIDENIVVATNYINKATVIFSKINEGNYIFYKACLNNLFDWGVKASHTTKALLYTIDRNIWFANNQEIYKNLDYLIVNRSHLANFLYRTVDITTEEEFLEYIISIYRIEVIANNLQESDIYSYFIRTNDINVELNYMYKYYIENNFLSIDKLRRGEQYIKTIWSNFNHLQDLIKRTRIKYPQLISKYEKYVCMKDINIDMNDFIYNMDKIENKIIKEIK